VCGCSIRAGKSNCRQRSGSARGGASIREYFLKDAATSTAAGLKGVEGPTSDVGVSGDLAWQGDTYRVVDKSGATVDTGKTLTVFQRRDAKWMIIRDTWNSDIASPSPEIAASTSAPRRLARNSAQ